MQPGLGSDSCAGHRLEALILDALREIGKGQIGGRLRLRAEAECCDAGREAIRRSRIVSRTKSCTNDAVPESHFGLRRVNVHVHLFAIAIQKQQREGIARRRHQVVIRRRERVQQQTVANQAAVHEQEDRIAIQSSAPAARRRSRAARRRGVVRSSASTTSQLALDIIQIDQVVERSGCRTPDRRAPAASRRA